VARLLADSGHTLVRRSEPTSDSDRDADIILLDSIGELRAAYPLAEIVFVGGSLIPHGGQSVIEPAAAGKAIITGPYTDNFAQVISKFKAKEAVIQIDGEIGLKNSLHALLTIRDLRITLGNNALVAMESGEQGSQRTVNLLKRIVG
jgi:3-deoxy-D-manno-octulosonic-acid transferase